MKFVRKILHALAAPMITRAEQHITKCCDAGVEMCMVGDDVFIRCSECKKYIGHVVSESIGKLESRYRVLMMDAC